MQPYVDAYNKEMEDRNALLHMEGMYFMCAIRATIGNQLSGKGHKPFEYPERPFVATDNMRKNERKRKAKQLFAELNIMKSNFERSKKES